MSDASTTPGDGGIKELKKGVDIFRVLCWVAAVFTVVILAWIIAEIARQAMPSISQFGLGFLFESKWVPSRDQFGVFPFLLGTIISSLIALLFAFPLGVAIAIFLSEDFLPLPIRQVVRFTVEMLAAIPSVVFGLWGIFVVIPLVKGFGDWAAATFEDTPGLDVVFGGPAYGNSMLTASLVLALMVLPTVTALSRTALVAVPETLRQGSYALGATRWETIFKVLLPTASPGIVAATILALGRAMGETMAIAMLIGNSSRLTGSILQPAGTLAGLLANQFAEAEGMQVASLMYAALLLVLITLFVNIAGELVLRYTQKATAGVR